MLCSACLPLLWKGLCGPANHQSLQGALLKTVPEAPAARGHPAHSSITLGMLMHVLICLEKGKVDGTKAEKKSYKEAECIRTSISPYVGAGWGNNQAADPSTIQESSRTREYLLYSAHPCVMRGWRQHSSQQPLHAGTHLMHTDRWIVVG